MAMIENRRKKSLIALSMVTPFIVVFATFFLYPLIEMIRISFTDAPLIGDGNWVGLQNYIKLLSDRLFVTSLKNNGYFVLLTVVPTTVIALLIALAVSRLSGIKQTIAMSLFFLPYVLPVSVVTEIWAGCSTCSSAFSNRSFRCWRANRSRFSRTPLGHADGRCRHHLVDERF